MRVAPLRIASSLLPYALASLTVVVVSAVALAGVVRAPGSDGMGPPARAPAVSAAPRAVNLSDSRMAYWRPASSGSLELWVSDLDGDPRWTIATASADADLALTRWSPDGTSVAYRTGNGTIGVVRLDGSLSSLVMPLDLRRAAWKIVSYEWSPDAKRIAATFRAGGGLSNESDVYVAEIKTNALWERVTTLGDAYAGPWIENDRLLIESSSGLVATLDLPTRDLRPVTGLPAASPQVGRDGRVYFTGGLAVTADVASQPVASGWVWSTTVDGDDLRKEVSAEHGQARLFGILADGRAVIGVPGGVYLASDTIVPLVFAGAGSVRRVVVSDDGKRVIGITDSRILRIDVAKIPRALALGSLPSSDSASTLLSGIREPDVWTARRPVAVARGSDVAVSPTAGRLAFVLGHALWQLQPDGSARAIATERGSLIGRPAWSPNGDLVSVLYTATGERQPSVLVVGPAGPQRWRLPSAAQGMTWSPDGKALTFWIPTGTRLDQWNTHAFDPVTGRSAGTIPGRAVWGGAGRLVLSDGEFAITTGTAAATGLRVGQKLELISGPERRTITDAARLAASPLLRNVPDATRSPLISQLVPSADPEYVGVMLARVGPTQIATTRSPAFVVVRVSDGEPVYATAIPLEAGPSDLAWSPVGHRVAWGVTATAPGGQVTRHAVLVDPVAGTMRTIDEGRFAGWSADGRYVYVARDEGLFVLPVDATPSDPVRISPFGVVVSATGR